MSKNLFSRYIWIIDTIRRHGTITREELNRLWMESSLSDGNPMPRRTFYNYRNAIEEVFRINIVCNPATFEYSIEDSGDAHAENVTDWMLNTASMSNMLTDARDIADRVFLEDVPSARMSLDTVIGAMKEFHQLDFRYSPFSRTGAPKPVRLEPYFLKIFKLRWYVTGRNVRENVIKTYALDRMTDFRHRILPRRDQKSDHPHRPAAGQIFPRTAPASLPERDDRRQLLDIHLPPAPHPRPRAGAAQPRPRHHRARPRRAPSHDERPTQKSSR